MKSKGNGLKVLLGIIIFSLFCIILLLCIGLPLILWKGILQGDLFIKLVSTVLSWPRAVAVICLVFFFLFQSSIRLFLEQIVSVKLPGGAEFLLQTEKDGSITLSSEEMEKITTIIDDLIRQKQLTGDQKKLYEEALLKEYRNSAYWKFQYLSLYFVPNTKNVLKWISQSRVKNRIEFHRNWETLIPNQSKRDIILTVLLENQMIKEEITGLSITPEGNVFLQFIGMIPIPQNQGRMN
jgi:hypothetical protein